MGRPQVTVPLRPDDCLACLWVHKEREAIRVRNPAAYRSIPDPRSVTFEPGMGSLRHEHDQEAK